MARVFVSGGTGYLGASLIPELLARGHPVRALTRPSSATRLHSGCESVIGDALDASTFRLAVPSCDTFVHLVGTSHPAPWKRNEFRAVDRTSLIASVEAGLYAGVAHFVYVSVAHPAPVMRDYIAVRIECEERLRIGRLNATILRPWYVLGPRHRWPYALLPLYRVAETISFTREGALRLGLVSLQEMTGALLWAVEHPAQNLRVLEVPAIRAVNSVVQEASAGA